MTYDEAHSLFEYRDGVLHWRVKPARRMTVGDSAGTVCGSGHLRVRYKRKTYAVHSVIWFLHYGVWPSEIDHIDTNKLNNKIENLRLANCKNQQNVGFRCDNTSGAKNVYWHASAKRWAVLVTADKIRHSLGYFDDFELADLVATEARNKYHGVFANHAR